MTSYRTSEGVVILCLIILISVVIIGQSEEHHHLYKSVVIPPSLLPIDRSSIRYPFGDWCSVDEGNTGIICIGLTTYHLFNPLPQPLPPVSVRFAELINCSLDLSDMKMMFPNVTSLFLTRSIIKGINTNATEGMSTSTWDSVLVLNISRNELDSSTLPNILPLFPNLQLLDISHNLIDQIELNLGPTSFSFPNLKWVDISDNPLDCTMPMPWLDHDGQVTLLHAEETLCHLPPHQNKAKPIWEVRKLIKKVRDKCRGNCTCDISYIWEQNHVIHSKTTVNCSGRGFNDFPDPDTLPNPTDTLDLSNNNIMSMRRFVEDERYEGLDVMNLHLDSNHLTSIALLETSDWFYNFQIFTFRNNAISEVPVYVLENVFVQNKRILQVDLSLNPFHCDCTTISTLKIWLLKHSANIKHIDDVLCSQTGTQIRYMRHEDWCTVPIDQQGIMDILDIISICLAMAILAIVAKVYYDYWNLKHNGKLPWVAKHMGAKM